MPEELPREVELLNAALELGLAERRAFLDEACANDPAMRQRIEELIAAEDDAGQFMDTPPTGVEGTQSRPAAAPLTEKPGDEIGRYKLLEQIGEGGCGVVYMAEQEEPVRRRVALKVIKLGMDTKQVIARFEAERQALALMDHPNIAKVLDAGTTQTGRPYFVMELIRGVKITNYCDETKSSTEERLKLFIQVCQAIQHAHQKGIIHRDIKPSNILVTITDGAPVPKVIDFGIAKATQGRLTDQTLFTAFEQFLGTPAYMSPEQAVLTSQDVDTRSDIYSLGVLLYELLTGRTPFDAKELLAAGIDEMRRTIREKEPPKPSTRLNSLAQAELTTTANHRQTAIPRLIHSVSGDLDWIVMKCLEKDRTRRYETAIGLGSDIQRHLAREPVVARPPTSFYRFQKSVQRNKLAFAAGTAVVASLVIGLTFSTVSFFGERAAREDAKQQAFKAIQEAAKAKEQEAVALAVVEFLQHDLIRQADTEAQVENHYVPNPDLTMREALERAAGQIGDSFKDRPLVEAAIRWSIGDALKGLGESERAIPHLERAVELRRAKLGSNDVQTLNSMNSLCLAYLYSGKGAQALKISKDTLEGRKITLGPTNEHTLESMNNLALAYHFNGKTPQALSLYKDTVELSKTALGPDHRNTLLSMGNMAATYDAAGQSDVALPLLEEVVKLMKEKVGLDDPHTMMTMHSLADAYRTAGKLDSAILLYDEVFKLEDAKLGPGHKQTIAAMNDLINCYLTKKNYSEAEALMRNHLAWIKERYGQPSAPHADMLASLGQFLLDRKAWARAELTLRECLEIREKIAPDGWRVFNARSMLGEALMGQKNLADAEPLLRAGYDGMKQHRDKSLSADTLKKACDRLIQLCEGTARAEKADELRQDYWAPEEKRIRNQLEDLRKRLPVDDPKLDGPLVSLTQVLIDERKYAQAEDIAKESLALREKNMPTRWLTFNTRSVLGGILVAQKKYSEAEPLLLAGYDGLWQQETKLPAAGKVCLRNAVDRLVQFYEETNQPEKAADWKKKLPELKEAQAEKK